MLVQAQPEGMVVSHCTEPTFFRLDQPHDREALAGLLQREPGLRITDNLLGQLRELVKISGPSRAWDDAALEEAVRQHLGHTEPWMYGVWVHYPWLGRLVHIVDEKEFVLLRTSRNLYKITGEERDRLATRKIGVIGLSVGQSVALTMAMERGFGELRIADFDSLELTNLNRIRTPLFNLGLPKVVAVAREIAEIDPFLKVRCFAEGLQQHNMEAFFLEGGALDIVVDECDSLDIKLSARRFARAHRIPVVMDTSDRGMIDIERFDLEPERPLLHGCINEAELRPGQALTTEQRIQLSVKIVGWDTISERLKFSLAEIGKSIVTWPQLASSVMLGGAAATQVCRKIALQEEVPSGRYFVDIDRILHEGSGI